MKSKSIEEVIQTIIDKDKNGKATIDEWKPVYGSLKIPYYPETSNPKRDLRIGNLERYLAYYNSIQNL